MVATRFIIPRSEIYQLAPSVVCSSLGEMWWQWSATWFIIGVVASVHVRRIEAGIGRNLLCQKSHVSHCDLDSSLCFELVNENEKRHREYSCAVVILWINGSVLPAVGSAKPASPASAFAGAPSPKNRTVGDRVRTCVSKLVVGKILADAKVILPVLKSTTFCQITTFWKYYLPRPIHLNLAVCAYSMVLRDSIIRVLIF